MSKMKVLLFGQWYRPEPAYGLQDIAQVLQRKGHRITVLTGFPNYPSGKLYPGYRLRPWQKEILNGVPVLRVPLYPDHSRSKIQRTLNYLSFALSSSLLGPLLVDKPDVIFVYHPPLTVGPPAYFMSRILRAPFIYQIQDMWPETLQATGMVSSPRVLSSVSKLAKWVYNKADAICVISPGFQKNLINKGVPPGKVFVIPNWVNTAKYYPAPFDRDRAKRLGFDDHFNIMFAGNIGEAQGLETIIYAAKQLISFPEIQFVLVGDGIALPRLREIATENNLNNVRFLERVPAEEMPHLYALADVLLVHLRDEPLFRITIPHKILSYLAVGKPILAAVAGDAADIIRNLGAGLICQPEDPEALASTALLFYRMSESERNEMGQGGLRGVAKYFEKERVIGQIEALMKSLVQSNQ